ncbi:MAG TPA: alpha-galactosidase [Microbacteriaceae bacterium]
MSLLPDGTGLVLDHWGAPVIGGVEPWSEPERVLSFVTPADVAPLEYASAGHRHTAFSELLVDRGDSRTGARFTCADPEAAGAVSFVIDGEDSILIVRFVDESGELTLTTRTSTSVAHDVVRRSATIENRSASRTITLPRVFSGGWALPVGQRARIDYLAGSWANEFHREHVELHWGTFSIGSRQGVTSLAFSPVVTVSALDDDSHAIAELGAYGIALEWSGCWRLQAESVAVGERLRVSCGVDDDTTTVTLLPGESFSAPDTVGLWSPAGPGGVSVGWHKYQRDYLARDLGEHHRPVVYNSWYATEFDVNVEQQLELARYAAELGAEVFVVDDGWFVGRVSDKAGLGDWTPDPAKFPDGLAALAQSVLDLKMRFGIWVEPEGVSEDSDLYRRHPEWVYQAAGRPLVTVRNQLVLDLGRDDVVAWVEDLLRRLLNSTPISYLKWDMNRSVSDGGRAGDPHGREWSVQHTRGYYRVLEMLRREFPGVTVEACSSGGGRIDNAVLARSDVVWTSDETGPVDRLGIQHGFLSAYPAHVMSSWVSDERGHHDRRDVSFEFRFTVAMAGVLGIGSDVTAWTPDQCVRAGELIARYKQIREIVHRGDVTVHGRPELPLYALEYSQTNEHTQSVCVIVYDRDRDRRRDTEAPRIRLSSLVADARYRIEGSDAIVTGAQAAVLGVDVPFALAADTDILVFHRLG